MLLRRANLEEKVIKAMLELGQDFRLPRSSSCKANERQMACSRLVPETRAHVCGSLRASRRLALRQVDGGQVIDDHMQAISPHTSFCRRAGNVGYVYGVWTVS